MKKFTFKQYETVATTRHNFKLRRVSCGKNYKDFDEIFEGEKNNSGNKLFKYFYKGPNAGKQEKSKNEVKSIEYYETNPQQQLLILSLNVKLLVKIIVNLKEYTVEKS